jgi:hypothetical protein
VENLQFHGILKDKNVVRITFVFIYLFLHVHTRREEREIRTSDLLFMRCGLQPIELLLGDFSFVFIQRQIKIIGFDLYSQSTSLSPLIFLIKVSRVMNTTINP